MRKHLVTVLLGTAFLLLTLSSSQSVSAAEGVKAAGDLAPLPLKLPDPTLKGTPDDLPTGPNIEKLSDKPRPAFFAPKGVTNVALKKKVTVSEPKLISGTIEQVTDGQREAFDEQVIEMRKGTQWVQVDLGGEYTLHAIVIWHDHRWLQVFRDVIVQVADDAEFTKNVHTVYNSDVDNSSNLGVGTDREYFETNQGRLIDCKGIKGAFVRSYTKGSSLSSFNCHQEIEVYGLPAK